MINYAEAGYRWCCSCHKVIKGKKKYGGMVTVGNKAYTCCEECWSLGFKIGQLSLRWPKKEEIK